MKYLFAIPALIIVTAFSPDLAQAQGIVPTDLCSGVNCSACELVELGNRLIKWLIGITMLLFAVLAVKAGFSLVTSRGNQSALQEAKKNFTNALIGLVIILSAWLVVDTLLRVLVGTDNQVEGYLAWSEVQCGTQTASQTIPGAVGDLEGVDLTEGIDGSSDGTDVFTTPGSSSNTGSDSTGSGSTGSGGTGGTGSGGTGTGDGYGGVGGTGSGVDGSDVITGPGEIGGSVTLVPTGTACFPGPNGVMDDGVFVGGTYSADGYGSGVYAGGPLPGGDDICLEASNVIGSSYNLPDASHLGYTAPTQYFGPADMVANPQLTANLKFCDVTNCQTDRMTGEYVVIDPYMVMQLDAIYTDLGGLEVVSGYRSPAYNQAIGGAIHSRHQYGDAVDILITEQNTADLIEASCKARGATNVYTYDSGREVHCDWGRAQR